MKLRLYILLLTAVAWLAATAQTTDSVVTLADVTVTALKQGDVPLATAATTLARRDVERNGILTVRDVSNLVPNFYLPDYGSRMTSTIYVRGLGARIDQPAMGLTIDNIPILCKENYDFDLSDIATVEMLRGPQSTLYGRNTMGGLMNISTLSPLSLQGTRFISEAASHGAFKAGASHYARVSPTLGLAAGGYYTRTAGEWRNDYSGARVGKERQGNVFLRAEWKPQPSLHISNTLRLTLSRQSGYPYEYLATGRIAYNDTCFYRRTAVLEGLTVTKQLPRLSIASITSYQYLDDNMTLDQDFLPEPYFTLTQARREHALTQELVLKSRGEGSYKWVAGAFGFYRRYSMDAPVTFKDTGIARLIEDHINATNPYYPVVWNTREFVLGSNFVNPTWGVAIYHQSSLRWHRFTFTAGARLDYEHTSLRYRSSTATGYRVVETATGATYHSQDINIDERGRLKKHFTELLPKFTVTYDFAPSSVYIAVSKGYKAGGFNTQMFSDVLQQQLMGLMGIGAAYDVNDIVGYRPEKAWNWELGAHLQSTGARLKVDAALFYIDCRDRQMTVFPDGTTTGRIMTNAGKTRSLGAEVSASLALTAALQLNASCGYCKAEFRRYDDGKADYRGNIVPYCPAHTLFAQALYTFNISGGGDLLRSVTLDLHTNACGRIYWNEANTVEQPFYALLGAALTFQGRHYSLQLWGRNLTDTDYDTFYFVSMSHDFVQRGHRRSLGATLRINL